MDCSPGSPLSPGSPPEHAHSSEDPTWVNPTNEGISNAMFDLEEYLNLTLL